MRISSLATIALLLTAGCSKSANEPAGGPGPDKVAEPGEPGKTGDDKPSDPPKVEDPFASWVDYTGPDNSYTARFPAKPDENTESMPVEGLPPQTMKSALYEAGGGTKAFITAVVDIEAPAGTTYDVPAGLKGAVEGMLSGMNATQDSTKDLALGAALGREVSFHGSMDGVNFKGMAHVYAIGGAKPRLFQANTLIIGSEPNDEMRHFLDGFKPNVPAEAAGAATKDAPVVAGEWVEHDAPLYKAKFPSKPEVQDSPMETAIGPRTMQLAVSANDVSGFMCGAVDLKVPSDTPFDTVKAIEGARDGLVKSVAGDVKPTESDIEMKGMKGREFRFEALGKGPNGTDMVGVARVIVDEKAGKRVYTLVALGQKPLDEKNVTQFFDSFEPKDGDAPAAVDPALPVEPAAPAGELSAVCKRFVDAYGTCLESMPEAARAPARDGLTQMQKAFAGAPKETADLACKQALDSAKGAMGTFCPAVKWD